MSLTSEALKAILGTNTDQVFLFICEISGTNFDTLRIVRNYEDVVSNGLTYTAKAFQITMPDQDENGNPTVSLRIDAVDNSLIQQLRLAEKKALDVSFSIVMASDPDSIQLGPFNMQLRSVTYDAFTIEGSLENLDVTREPYPADLFTPFTTPGIFSDVNA